MPRRRRPYEIREKNRHGNYRWYFRRPGQIRVRLPDNYNSAEYIDAYNAAFAGKLIVQAVDRPATHTVSWLVDQYRQSAPFKALRPSTQKMRDNILKRFVTLSGTVAFAVIKKHHIQEGMDAKADTPFAANNSLKALRKLFEWAVSVNHILVNPCDGVKAIKASTDGFHSWSVDEVEQYRQKHPVGTRARLALDILLFLGLRRGDIVRVGRQHVRDGVVSMRTSKTNTPLYLTIWPELQRSIDATQTGDLAFMVTSYGKPFTSAASFGNWFADQCDLAKLPKICRAHGLRKAGATIAADNGATAHQLCAMYGWTKLATAEIYTKEADRRRLAREGSMFIANDRTLLLGAAEILENAVNSNT